MPHPPLRTGQADFPHPAHQLVVCSITETGDFEFLGIKQAEEPKFREVAVGPALMVGAMTAAFATATFSKDGAQSHADPSIDCCQLAVFNVFEVGVPADECSVQVHHDGVHTSPVGPAGPCSDGFAQLA